MDTVSAEAVLFVVGSDDVPEPDQPPRVWLCAKTRLWDYEPRLACVGKGGHPARSHQTCGWYHGEV